MDPQERDLLTTLLTRLKSTAGQPKEPEAEALIRQAVTEQPDAPYYLAQTVLIQDLSLHNAQNRITELERQLTDAQQQAARPAPTSFLGSLFGARPAQPPAPPPASPPAGGSVPAAGPWTRAPQVAAAPPAQPYGQPYPPGGYGPAPGPGGGFMGGGMGGGGGFLRSAAATAAGIAGGALLFQGIESMFGRGASAGILGGQGVTPGLGETVVNNYYGDAGAGQGGDQDFSGGSLDPSGGNYDPSAGQDQDFSGGGDSGGQDYASDQDFSSDQDFDGGQDQDFSGGGDMNQC